SGTDSCRQTPFPHQHIATSILAGKLRFRGWVFRISIGAITEAAVANTNFDARLFRGHANGTIQPDDFAVQHFVFEDMPDQRRVFGWTAKPRRERHLL